MMQPPERMEWRDIATAPKDGTLILVRGKPTDHPGLEVEFLAESTFTAYYEPIDEAFCINGGDWMGPFIEPTAWMPLPAPPTEGK